MEKTPADVEKHQNIALFVRIIRRGQKSGNNKRKSKKPYISRAFGTVEWFFDTVLIQKRIIHNGKYVYLICMQRIGLCVA